MYYPLGLCLESASSTRDEMRAQSTTIAQGESGMISETRASKSAFTMRDVKSITSNVLPIRSFEPCIHVIVHCNFSIKLPFTFKL